MNSISRLRCNQTLNKENSNHAILIIYDGNDHEIRIYKQTLLPLILSPSQAILSTSPAIMAAGDQQTSQAQAQQGQQTQQAEAIQGKEGIPSCPVPPPNKPLPPIPKP